MRGLLRRSLNFTEMKTKYLHLCVFCCVLLLMAGCNNGKKEAESLLEEARNSYKTEEYVVSKQLLDSLKSTYPQQPEVLKEALQLMRQVELKEQERTLAFSDSMLTVRREEAEILKKKFLFEKNKEYEEMGKYISKHQQPELNLYRSYLRSGVNEIGEMYLEGVYYGKPIQFTKLKVSSPTGEYTETESITPDGALNYHFTDGGATTQIVTFQKGRDNGVISFICDNYKKKLKVEYIGSRSFSMQIREQDKKAMEELRELSIVLSDVERLKEEMEKSKKRMEYLSSKITGSLSQASD